MNQVYLKAPEDFPVDMGGMTLHLSSYQVTGVCTVSEQGTADGLSAVTAVCPKGTRVELRGMLLPELQAETLISILSHYLRYGAATSFQIGRLRYNGARLCGYTIGEGTEKTEYVLKFYMPDPPVWEAAEA